MVDLSVLFQSLHVQKKTLTHSISLQLEFYVGGYYVRGEGSGRKEDWLQIYYHKDMDLEGVDYMLHVNENNLVAVASFKYEIAFVTDLLFDKVKKDIVGSGLRCCPVPSLTEEVICCSNMKMLPDDFQNICWIDDDFLYDETKEFVFTDFEKIDEGVKYLNPSHFSEKQLVEYMEYASHL